MSKKNFLVAVSTSLALGAMLSVCAQERTDQESKAFWIAQNKEHSMQFEVIKKGRQSGITQMETDVITNQEDWQKLWERHDPSKLNKITNIDFSKKTVLAVFLGERPNAGYSVEIVSITAAPTATKVAYTVKKPAPGAMTAQMMTQPCHIVVCDKVPSTVTFEER
ncbi:MAG: protease complex subunit PrcB family protein [Candidatus Obscuribacterales bacterium]|nr:protease complex subunit PrcB family protein [Candidatus Obscuribacterales bacterium]